MARNKITNNKLSNNKLSNLSNLSKLSKLSNLSYFSSQLSKSPQFLASLDKITNVDHKSAEMLVSDFLDSQAEPLDSQAELTISNLLLLNSPEFPPELLSQYCNKTGRLLRARPSAEFAAALSVLSIEELTDRLQLQFGDHYAIEWLDTSPSKLRLLTKTDPIGYFIYTVGLLYQFDIDPVNDRKIQLQTRNQFLLDKITAHSNLSQLAQSNPATLTQITVCNELIRRVIGLIKPQNIRKFARFNYGTINSWTGKFEDLELLETSIKDLIKQFLLTHFKSVKASRIEKFESDRKIKYVDLEELRKKMGGLRNFHSQPKLKNCAEREAILFDLFDVLDLEGEFQEFQEFQEIEEIKEIEEIEEIEDIKDVDLSGIDFVSEIREDTEVPDLTTISLGISTREAKLGKLGKLGRSSSAPRANSINTPTQSTTQINNLANLLKKSLAT